MNNNTWMSTAMVRVSILGFWLVVCLLFLIIPKLVDFLTVSKSITILSWPTLIDTQKLIDFERESGIKVHIRYFENNEELLAKIQKTKGKGYDLIMPSDYMIETMIKSNLIKKIDKTKLTFFNDLYPHLVGNYYDPLNDYSIPFFWSIYGIAYNENYFKNEPSSSWGLVFDPSLMQPHMCMIDDMRELIALASFYKYGKQERLSSEQIEEIIKMLIEQKKFVEVYTEDRANFLLAGNESPVAVILSAVVARIMKKFPFIKFMIPEQGSFLVIDSFVIPITSTKDNLVYTFLNYMYKAEILDYYSKKYGYFPALKSLPPSTIIPLPDQAQFSKIHFFKNTMSSEQMNKIWVTLKA